MCGIVGYTGGRDAVGVLIDGLSNLEYRGYDSSGISLLQAGRIITVKARGRLQNMIDQLKARGAPRGNCGIGHTRWATHGAPSDENSHPHGTEKLSLVHNGIIENYLPLREFLTENGCTFTTQTDTEAVAKLIDYLYQGDPVAAIREAIGRVEGSYALCIVFADRPGAVYGVRSDSPLIIGFGQGENFFASDVPAILQYTRQYSLLDEKEIAAIYPDRVEVVDASGRRVEKERHTATWDIAQARKAGYPHFMLKEIYEQPGALRGTIHPRVADGLPDFTADGIPGGFFGKYSKIFFVACGTAMHAGAVGKSLMEAMARTPAEVDVASEFRYRNPILSPDTLVLLISQSGETADTLAALRLAKARGADTLAIVNVAGSSIAREADYVLHTYAGPEIAVASTKAFSVQLGILYLIAIDTARDKGLLDNGEARRQTAALMQAVEEAPQVIGLSGEIRSIAERFAGANSLFYMGRGVDHSLAMEGSLKLKEISYIHSEACAAGELKHGTISLITDGVPVVGLATQAALLPKTLSNIKEVRSRGGHVLLVAKEGCGIDGELCDHLITLPPVEEIYLPLLSVIVLQLFAYHVAVARGCDVDKPRNLAKSVTVE